MVLQFSRFIDEKGEVCGGEILYIKTARWERKTQTHIELPLNLIIVSLHPRKASDKEYAKEHSHKHMEAK